MGNPNKQQKFVISVGGSLIVPNGEINFKFLTKLNMFIRDQLAQNKKRQFFLVIGGGASARSYRDAGRDVVSRELTLDDLDWLGIHATRLNAHLVRTIFRDIAHQVIIDDYTIIRKAKEPVVVAAGWKPGWSTDFCATLLCEDYHVDTIINLSNVSQVYDKDPNKFPDAKPKDKMSWKEFRLLVGDTWVPGMHAPFDPVAAKKAEELGVRVVVMSDDFKNIARYFKGENFLGTVIE
jgi:uridylate kinase